jgi:hypothetical protein
VTNINHTPFERGENLLLLDNKISFLERIYRTDIRTTFCVVLLQKKCGYILSVPLFHCLIPFTNAL